MPEENLRELAESLPEVDAVVGGPTGQPIEPGSHAGVVLLTSATKQGKFMAKLTCAASAIKRIALRGEIVELDGHFADEPRQAENVEQFYDELKRRDLPPGETSFLEGKPSQFAGNPRNAIAGSDACKSCHDEDYRSWKNSKHAEAWKSLVDKDAQYNPDCQRCHVTGYGESGRICHGRRATPKRVGVGCESCHGMSRQHCRTTSTKTALGRTGERSLPRLPRPRKQPEIRLRHLLGKNQARQAGHRAGRNRNRKTSSEESL